MVKYTSRVKKFNKKTGKWYWCYKYSKKNSASNKKSISYTGNNSNNSNKISYTGIYGKLLRTSLPTKRQLRKYINRRFPRKRYHRHKSYYCPKCEERKYQNQRNRGNRLQIQQNVGNVNIPQDNGKFRDEKY